MRSPEIARNEGISRSPKTYSTHSDLCSLCTPLRLSEGLSTLFVSWRKRFAPASLSPEGASRVLMEGSRAVAAPWERRAGALPVARRPRPQLKNPSERERMSGL